MLEAQPIKAANVPSEGGPGPPLTKHPTLRVTVLGRCTRPEFSAAMRVLRDNAQVTMAPFQTPATNSRHGGIADEADRELPADLIVLLQGFAGEFNGQHLDPLIRQNPLAPLICILGSYSEGETRSGVPLERAHRISWYEAAPRLQLSFDAWQRGECSWWSWPTTLTGPERGLLLQQLAAEPLAGRVGVFAATQDAAQPIVDALAAAGATAIYVPPTAQSCPDLAAAIWDGAAAGRFQTMPLSQAVQLSQAAPVIALYTFPRTQDIASATASGAWAVLPKLQAAADLRWCITQAARQRVGDPLPSQSSVA